MNTKEQRYLDFVADKIFFINVLTSLGIEKTYTGFYFLVEILDKLINQSVDTRCFSKDIYPKVALKFNKSDCVIERDIRSLIDKCWSEEMRIKLCSSWEENKTPSCIKFVLMLKSYIINLIN